MKLTPGDGRFDQRTLTRFLREKRLTQKEIDEYLKKLPDESKNAEPIALGEEAASAPAKKQQAKTPTFAAAEEEAATA